MRTRLSLIALLVSIFPVAHGCMSLSAREKSDAVRRQKLDEFRERFANPCIAAERGYVDDVIEPHETRPKIIKALRMLETKVDTMPRKKHGNIPL